MKLTFDKTNDIIDLELESGAQFRLSFEEGAEFGRRLIHFLKEGRDAPPLELKKGILAPRPLPPIPQEVRNLVVNPYVELLSNDQNPSTAEE